MSTPTPAVLTTPCTWQQLLDCCTWQQLLDWVNATLGVFEGTEMPNAGIATTTSSITLSV